jgi:hypothetical protein
MCSKDTKQIIATLWFLAVMPGLLFTSHAAWATAIDGTAKWAWSSNAGWNNFRDVNGGVSVYNDHLEGYAWTENIGWIRLGAYTGRNTHAYTNTSKTDYGVNRNPTTGELSGFGWATNAGWINFKPTHGGGVFIDPATCNFSGYAWAENIGWIKLEGTAINASAYKVALIRGDVNNDGLVKLDDVILILQVLAGIPPSQPVFSDADINHDGRLGNEEAIYILQKVAGIR